MLSGKTQEIRTIYDQNNTGRSPFGRSDEGMILELEAKFGHYSGKGFNSNVPYVHYERLLNLLRERVGREITEESQVAQTDNIRRVITVPIGDQPEIILWQRKRRIRDFEFNEHDIRVSINKEETLNPDEIPKSFTPTVTRDRTRHTFMMADGVIQVDLTEVMMRSEDKIIRPRYEVEAEFLGTPDQLHIFEQHIGIIFRLLRGTNIIYTNTVKNRLVQDVNRVLGGTRHDTIDKDVLVEARNIKRRDLVWGGIVGNPTTKYMVTYKADGLRKILIIHSTGIWLVYPPFEFNLVLDLSLNVPNLPQLLQGFNGTIFDGELVLPKGEKQVSHWYLAFDCLAFQGKAGIQNDPYPKRQQIVQAISGVMKTPILTIDTKRTELINTPEDFFNLVPDFLSKRDALEFKEDGLIFFPANTVYNPHSEKYELYERSLTRVPDTCKFKEGLDITIDFSLRWMENGLLDLYVFDKKSKQEVPFRGDLINPITPDMIDYTNELIRNKPSGLVVEFEYVAGLFQPRRIRYDKSGPNKLDIALDDWEDIRHPITQDDIEGNTLMMTTAYHNRIKKGLYGVLPRGANILDIGSGRGGDVPKWISLATKTKGQPIPGTGLVVAVEPNEDNREELISRINAFGMNDRVEIVPTGGEDTIAITDTVRRFIPGGKVDAVTLMLSMSFFWASDSHLDALVNTIVTNLKPGGMVIFLTINGDVVEQIFEPSLGGEWSTDKRIVTADLHLYPKENRYYEQPTRGLYGRSLDFFLPDTIVGQQREYLVHIADFTSRLSQYGINLHELHRAEGEKLLSKENMLFSSMYSYGYYVNDDKSALEQYERTTPAPINTPLPVIPQIIPQTIISPDIKMNLPSPSPDTNIIDMTLAPISPRIQPNIILSPPKSPERPQIAIIPSPTVIPQLTIPTIVPTLAIPTIPPLSNTPITIPIISNPERNVEQNQLDWLAVSYAGRGGRVLKGPAINDDTYAPLTCTWYDNLVRIATIGDGSCFIHAVLKGFFREYQDNRDAAYRLNIAAQIRRDLAITLGLENPQYPGHTYWETSARGSFPRMVMQQINDEELIGVLRVDYSLSGLQRLFNSTSQLGDEVYTFVSDALGVDIYILRATRQDLYPHYHTRRPGNDRPGVVVIGNMYHYEVLAVDTPNGFQTVFLQGDPFLDALTNLFIGDGGFNDIINTVPYDPDTAFISEVVGAFTQINFDVDPVEYRFEVPAIVNEIFPEGDPFRSELERLSPLIAEAAQNRLNEITMYGAQPPVVNPVLIRLNRILDILLQSDDDIRQIREIVEHRIIPGADNHINAIIADAETDGLLSHDIVDAILNAEATL